MPAPSSTTFQRPDLGQSFEEFDLLASMQGFVGFRVLPLFPVARQTANFSKVPVEALLQERRTNRASGSGYNRQDYEFEQDNYACQEHGAEEVIDDRERAIYAYTIDFERIAAMRALDAVLRNTERRIAAEAFSTTNFTGPLTAAVGTEWSKGATATPIDDVKDAITAFKANCGMLPNAIIFNDEVMRNLTLSDQIIDRVKYSGLDDPKKITSSMLAALFDLQQVIVPNAMRNSALQGQAVAFADIWDDEYALLLRVCTTNDLREPCLGRTFHFTGDGSSEGGTVEMYRDESRRSDIIRARLDLDEKVIYTAMGYLMSNITE